LCFMAEESPTGAAVAPVAFALNDDAPDVRPRNERPCFSAPILTRLALAVALYARRGEGPQSTFLSVSPEVITLSQQTLYYC
jgi:hypothetical protein